VQGVLEYYAGGRGGFPDVHGHASGNRGRYALYRGFAYPFFAAAAAANAADLYLLTASPHIENAWSKHRGEQQWYRATSADDGGGGTTPTVKILLQPTPPSDPALRAHNWLPTPADG
jgi:hypothetical protein